LISLGLWATERKHPSTKNKTSFRGDFLILRQF
jgi:hypothetical protein